MTNGAERPNNATVEENGDGEREEGESAKEQKVGLNLLKKLLSEEDQELETEEEIIPKVTGLFPENQQAKLREKLEDLAKIKKSWFQSAENRQKTYNILTDLEKESSDLQASLNPEQYQAIREMINSAWDTLAQNPLNIQEQARLSDLNKILAEIKETLMTTGQLSSNQMERLASVFSREKLSQDLEKEIRETPVKFLYKRIDLLETYEHVGEIFQDTLVQQALMSRRYFLEGEERAGIKANPKLYEQFEAALGAKLFDSFIKADDGLPNMVGRASNYMTYKWNAYIGMKAAEKLTRIKEDGTEEEYYDGMSKALINMQRRKDEIGDTRTLVAEAFRMHEVFGREFAPKNLKGREPVTKKINLGIGLRGEDERLIGNEENEGILQKLGYTDLENFLPEDLLSVEIKNRLDEVFSRIYDSQGNIRDDIPLTPEDREVLKSFEKDMDFYRRKGESHWRMMQRDIHWDKRQIGATTYNGWRVLRPEYFMERQKTGTPYIKKEFINKGIAADDRYENLWMQAEELEGRATTEEEREDVERLKDSARNQKQEAAKTLKWLYINNVHDVKDLLSRERYAHYLADPEISDLAYHYIFTTDSGKEIKISPDELNNMTDEAKRKHIRKMPTGEYQRFIDDDALNARGSIRTLYKARIEDMDFEKNAPYGDNPLSDEYDRMSKVEPFIKEGLWGRKHFAEVPNRENVFKAHDLIAWTGDTERAQELMYEYMRIMLIVNTSRHADELGTKRWGIPQVRTEIAQAFANSVISYKHAKALAKEFHATNLEYNLAIISDALILGAAPGILEKILKELEKAGSQ